MKVTCPNCHKEVIVKGLGRIPFNVPVIKVCDTLGGYPSVTLAANNLGVSRGYIYKLLKANDLKVKDYLGVKNADGTIKSIT